MAPTNRVYDQEKNRRTEDIFASLKRDPNRDLAIFPPSFVTRRDAMRVWGLSEENLKQIDANGYIASNRGQEGIFYTEADIKNLKDHVLYTSEIEPDMIPEVAIRRQVPKKNLNLDVLRQFAVRGRKPGHKGKDTFYYKKEDIEACLTVNIIGERDREGFDYISAENVPAILQLELHQPRLGLKLNGNNYTMAKPCYFGSEVDAIHKSPLMRTTTTKTSIQTSKSDQTEDNPSDNCDKSQVGRAQPQYGGVHLKYSGVQSQYGGSQSQYGGAQTQYGGAQSQNGGTHSQYAGAKSQISEDQSQYGGAQFSGDQSQEDGAQSKDGGTQSQVVGAQSHDIGARSPVGSLFSVTRRLISHNHLHNSKQTSIGD